MLNKYELLILCIFLFGFLQLNKQRLEQSCKNFKRQISPWCSLEKFSREKTRQKIKYKIYTSVLIPYKWLTKCYARNLFSECLQKKTYEQVVSRAPVPNSSLPWHSELEKVSPFGQKQLCTREQGTGLGKQNGASKIL